MLVLKLKSTPCVVWLHMFNMFKELIELWLWKLAVLCVWIALLQCVHHNCFVCLGSYCVWAAELQGGVNAGHDGDEESSQESDSKKSWGEVTGDSWFPGVWGLKSWTSTWRGLWFHKCSNHLCMLKKAWWSSCKTAWKLERPQGTQSTVALCSYI